MTKGYKKALDELRFSPEAKRRMVSNLEAATQSKPGSERKRRSLVMVAAAAAFALMAGCTAYASGAFVGATKAVEKATEVPPAPIEVVNGIGRPIGASATSNGVTITASSVMGDRFGYAVVFDIAKDDGTAFEGIEEREDGTLALDFENEGGIAVIDGAYSQGTYAYFIDLDPSDNAIQYVKKCVVDPEGVARLSGETMRVSFKNLTAIDADGGKHVLAEGVWKMRFAVDYGVYSIDLPTRDSFAFGKGTGTISSIVLSRLNLSINFTLDYRISYDPEGVSPEYEHLFFHPIITVNYKDGTKLDASNASTLIAPSQNKTECEKFIPFEQIIDLEDVVSVTVGDAEIPVP